MTRLQRMMARLINRNINTVDPKEQALRKAQGLQRAGIAFYESKVESLKESIEAADKGLLE